MLHRMRNIFSFKKNWDAIDENIIKEYNLFRDSENKEYICYSPFKSMFFRMRGEVNACCYNTIYCLGSYPENSPMEIWNGKQANKLRDYFKHNDLSLGCHWCKDKLINRKFNSLTSLSYDCYPYHPDFPTHLEFELNNTCNLECSMCSSHSSSSVSSKKKNSHYKSPYDKAFVKLLEPLIPHLQEAKFSGGEPFLIEIYYDIWEKIISINPNCRIYIQTNGSVLNERVKSFIDRGNFVISISLDSVIKETYEKIRVNNSFDTFMKNISYFSECYKSKNIKDLYFSTSIMKQNWEEASSILNFLNSNNYRTSFCSVIIPQHCSLWHSDSEKLKKIVEYFNSFKLPEETPHQKINKELFYSFSYELELWINVKREREKEIVTFRNKEDKFILNQLLERIRISINQYNHLNNKEKKSLYSDCLNKLNIVLSTFSKEKQRKVIINLYELPLNYLIDGLKTENKERIIEACDDTVDFYDNILN